MLTALSPLDGRYASKTRALVPYFSEYALMKYRVRVEILYFLALTRTQLKPLQGLPEGTEQQLLQIIDRFTPEEAQRIKDIESITNHDVKAVEYYLKEQFDKIGGLDRFKEFIHFGLTSQDINNTSFPMMLNESLKEVVVPQLQALTDHVAALAEEWKEIPMLARTHGQPASPTRLGKEFQVWAYRLSEQLHTLAQVKMTAKFGGATGNLNAHHVAFPHVDWREFANRFVREDLHLQREQWTTQISNYDHLAAAFDALRRLSVVLIDLCRDIWQYISMDYFKQRIKEGEVGSSAMPHKVNPIDFENAEGNLGVAIALLEHLAHKLPISRLQRDLTDSTVLRNIGVPLGHILIALASIEKGLGKLLLNQQRLQADLEAQWAVVAEAIQTILRREGFPKPYEALKALTRRNEAITEERIHEFIQTLDVNPSVKEELLHITPWNYTGI